MMALFRYEGGNMHFEKLQYLFDPLCGWCYASAPALSYLAQHHADQLELMPSGLFSDEGARDITAEWAEYAWSNDRRIASLTGQPFSERYHQLLLTGTRFDSTFMNRALTMVRDITPSAEPQLLHTLQHARYVEGRDTSRPDVVGDIVEDWAGKNNLALKHEQVILALDTDKALRHITDARIAEVKRLMDQRGIRGVPALLATVNGTEHMIGGHALYGGAEKLRAKLLALG
ncbi:DsbA family protein [Enterobacter chengduensis]|uniref:DsbA family protein n=1 Tax=Enterobacter chengduensis TaxID=2494701 RepID=UPI0020034E5F|nr:protein-disulfide isomerase [Enterobacter chengduensis]MCK7430496.1 protein-disulfide isomerase [Enterobacter chengduensis]